MVPAALLPLPSVQVTPRPEACSNHPGSQEKSYSHEELREDSRTPQRCRTRCEMSGCCVLPVVPVSRAGWGVSAWPGLRKARASRASSTTQAVPWQRPSSGRAQRNLSSRTQTETKLCAKEKKRFCLLPAGNQRKPCRLSKVQ